MYYINNKDTVITLIQQGIAKLGQSTNLQENTIYAKSTNLQENALYKQ